MFNSKLKTALVQVDDRLSALEKALEAARERLQGVEARMEVLESQARSLALEWDDSYEKLRSLFGRVSKRIERADKESQPNGEADRPINPAAQRILSQGLRR